MYSAHNEGKSVVAERFIRSLRNKIYKYITSVSKNVSIDKLDYIINKYNNTYCSTISIKPVDINKTHMLTLVKKLMVKIRNLKLVIILEDQNVRMFLQKVTLQIGMNKFLWLKKLKILCCRHLLSLILMAKRLLEHFRKRNCKKQIKKNLELKKWSREKVINYMLNEKVTITNSWIDKKHVV